MLDEERSHFQWPIEDVLSRLGWDGETRHTRGKWTDIRCPFHDDRKIGNAGFNVVLNTFKCQACGVGGNSVSLVMKTLGKPEPEAVEWLGEGGRVSTPPPTRWRYAR